MKYEVVIGLEVHVQLATASKLFCSCPTSFGVAPNSNVCEVCTGMPGVLPVLNKRAVEFAVKAGLALNCTINNNSIFARKNYFYPDMPFNYQVSQFDRPICEYGHLDIKVGGSDKRIGITRIHLETDAGKSIHQGRESQVDLNRAGVPLIEIVSEPDLRSAEEAVAYLKTLHSIVVYLGLSDGNMEEGSFRCDANVSIRPQGSEVLGTRTELKNLNSFRFVHRAINYEIARQEDVLADGGKVIQQTRLYDSVKDLTVAMRDKEEAHDYRYFPDPDLIQVELAEADLQAWAKEMPELPMSRKARYLQDFNLSEPESESLSSSRELGDFFEACLKLYAEPKKLANLMLGLVLREINLGNKLQTAALRPELLVALAKLVAEGTINQKIAQDMFGEIYNQGVPPEEIIKRDNLAQVSDTSAIEQAMQEVIAANPKEVAEYKAGKTKLAGFFVGQVMRTMQGKANPALVNEVLAKLLA